MTDTTRAQLDRLMDGVPVGPAPVDNLLAAGRAARRRRNRRLVAGTAAATALVVGGAALTTQAATPPGVSDGSTPVAGEPTPGGPDLTVRVETGSTVEGRQLLSRLTWYDGAVWDPDRELVYWPSDHGYSSSCPPAARLVTHEREAVTVVLRDDEEAGSACTRDAVEVVVVVDGFDEAPPRLTVAAAGGTRSYPVTDLLETRGPNRGPNPHLDVGERAEFRVFVWCGLRYVDVGGETWETRPRGGGSVPAGWPDVVRGTAVRVTENTIVFRSNVVGELIAFHPSTGRGDVACY